MRTPKILRLIVVFVAVGVAAGCAASSRVPAVAARSQPQSLQGQDRRECDAAAAAATTRRVGSVRYAACMAARGYQVTLPVTVGVEHGRLALASGAHSETQIVDDVGVCERSAEQRSLPANVVSGSIGAVVGGTDTTQVAPHGTATRAVERTVAACLVERGYRAAPSGEAGR